MANAVITVLEADGTTETDVTVLDVGRQGASASKSLATCTEDKAVLDAMAASLATIDNVVLAEDSAHSSGHSGVMALFVRQDSHADLAADGDYIPATVDADGGLRVSIVAGAGSGGTSVADDADFIDGTTSGTPVMGVYESTPTTVTDGDIGMVGITVNRRLKTSAEITGDAATDLATLADNLVAEGQTTAAGSIPVVPASDWGPSATAGYSIFRSLDLDEGALEVIKASPGVLYKLRIANRATTLRYVKIYNATSGTAGTGTPVDTIVLKAAPASSAEIMTESYGTHGAFFSTGICIGATTGLADNDTGAPAANDVVVTAFYK